MRVLESFGTLSITNLRLPPNVVDVLDAASVANFNTKMFRLECIFSRSTAASTVRALTMNYLLMIFFFVEDD